MSKIDKQAVQAVADLKAGYTLGHADLAILNELARIALASLEAEAVCVIDQSNLDYLKSGADADVWPASRKEMGDVLLYRTAPPAPANAEPVAWLWSHRKHPSEVTLVRPEDDERAEGAHWSGWSCQALYAAPPAPVSVPDAMEMDDDFDSAFEHGKAVGWNACRAAMLQGVENAETPTTMQTAPALDSSPKIAELPSGNSPVIPDGWVMVPEDPTHEMLEAGDEQFGTYDVYRRMIEAAPKLE
ncbi:ead/Ea22-like family protein [Enterobacter kobei]|uniref:ead/Ea22-like family protein n=1 Tax=Enterobacter kobei TaxID=208224 RepID=UPI003351D430